MFYAGMVSAQESLPFPEPPSASTAGKTLKDSKHQWRTTPSHLPKDAPNIVIFMTDDAGFSNPSTFGGPGPSWANFLTEIDQWVETGKAPDQITAYFVDEKMQSAGSRLLCAHPQVAKYDGPLGALAVLGGICPGCRWNPHPLSRALGDSPVYPIRRANVSAGDWSDQSS